MLQHCGDVNLHTGWPKKKATAKLLKKHIKSHECLPMRLDFFVKLKYQSLTISLFVRIKDSGRDLLCDL